MHVFVALQEDAEDVAVVGVFRSLRAAAESFVSTDDAWEETIPGRWVDGTGLRVERHALV
jgi:hypothetical protein